MEESCFFINENLNGEEQTDMSKRKRNVFICSQWPYKAVNSVRDLATLFCVGRRDFNCAANFSFAQLAKRKSLGRSKPATIPKHKHCNTLCGMFLLYPRLTEQPSIEMNWALQDVSELGYLFLDDSSLHIIAWDLGVERSQLWSLMIKLEWCQIL